MPRAGLITLVLMAAMAAAASPASAAPGALDPRFGNGGTEIFADGTYQSTAEDMLVQPGGGVIVAGYDDSKPTVRRLRPDGSLDPGFTTTGLSSLGLENAVDDEFSVAATAKGKLVVALPISNSVAPNDRIVLARLKRNGRLDRGFGDRGMVDTGLVSAFYPGDTAMALAKGGRIVVAASAPGDIATTFTGGVLVARFHRDGSPDRSFSGEGSTIVGPANAMTASVAALRGGAIAVAARWSTGQSAVVRLDESGSVDRAFGEDGVAPVHLSSVYLPTAGNEPLDMTSYRNGRLAICGDAGSSAFLAVLSRTGALKSRFVLDQGANSYSSFNSLALDPAGRIAVAGYSLGGAAVGLFHRGGDLDASFGAGGITTTEFGGDASFFDAIAAQPNGKLVAAGARAEYEFRSEYLDLALARYLGAGRR